MVGSVSRPPVQLHALCSDHKNRVEPNNRYSGISNDHLSLPPDTKFRLPTQWLTVSHVLPTQGGRRAASTVRAPVRLPLVRLRSGRLSHLPRGHLPRTASVPVLIRTKMCVCFFPRRCAPHSTIAFSFFLWFTRESDVLFKVFYSNSFGLMSSSFSNVDY